MARRRRVYRRSRPLKTARYSNETIQSAIDFYLSTADDFANPQFRIPLITSTDAQGMRKAKNFTLRICTNSGAPLCWALVYTPQGTEPKELQFGDTNAVVPMYEPNQNVIISGFTKAGQAQESYHTRLARNLNSGDAIGLVIRQIAPYVPSEDEEPVVNGDFQGFYRCQVCLQLNYAISY